jgi:hypothetical protein
LSKSCQKVVKVVKKLYKFKTSGEDKEEEEDWWLQDQVATLSHLVNMFQKLFQMATYLPTTDIQLALPVSARKVKPGKSSRHFFAFGRQQSCLPKA